MLLTVWLVAGLATLLLVWAVWRAATDRAVILRQLIFSGAVIVALVAQIVVGAVAFARGHEASDPVLFWGYTITSLFLLPLAGAWAFADRSRWSSVVLAVAAFAFLVMQARVWQVWEP